MRQRLITVGYAARDEDPVEDHLRETQNRHFRFYIITWVTFMLQHVL
jgi:hypothetical protein